MVLGKIFSLQEHLLNISTIRLERTDQTENGSAELPFTIHSISSYPTAEIILGAFIYMVIIMMTIIGNCMVVIAIFSYRPLRKVQNYFLVSLAASDLCVATFVMPLHVVKFLAGGRWLLGITLCQAFTTADILLCTSSILNLCAIALDRYWAIHDPIKYAQKRTFKFVTLTIAVVWLLSVCISVPPIIGWNDWSGETQKTRCELTTDKAFVIFSASGSFFFPLVVMVIVYVKIFLSARQRIRSNRGRSALFRISKMASLDGTTLNSMEGWRSTQRNFRGDKSLHTSTSRTLRENNEMNLDKHSNIVSSSAIGRNRETTSSISLCESRDDSQITTSVLRKREKISVAKEKRAAKTIAVIIFAFSFCWMPFFCAYVIVPFCETCSLHPKVSQVFIWLGYVNSSLNPFLYGILNMEFRRAFRSMLCSKKPIRKRRRRSTECR